MNLFSYTSSEIVIKEYSKDNFIINNYKDDGDVALFCSSNGLYFPNEEAIFKKYVVDKKRFEWNSKNYINKTFGKYIYIRDVFKQWYIKGINDKINTYNELINFIKQESTDKKLITIGSSAGGYAAMLIGCSLNADYVLCFSGQFDLNHIIDNHSKSNPLYVQESEKNTEFINIQNIIRHSSSTVFYFVSSKSEEDYRDINIAKSIPNVKTFYFSGNVHGVPIVNFALSKIIAKSKKELIELHERYNGKIINKYLFELKLVGLKTFLVGYFTIFTKKVFK